MMVIDAAHLFPHSVIPKVICLTCKRRLTIVIPSNTPLFELYCPCGSQHLMVGIAQ